MESSYERMFQYAKAVGAEALENYTSEALAGLIRSDKNNASAASPMLAALTALDSHGTLLSGHTQIVSVKSQVGIPHGQIDLILSLQDEAGDILELWIEIKVNAIVSGNQLEKYEDAIKKRERGDKLITLGPSSLAEHIPHLTWQALWNCIHDDSSFHWHEFKLFLKEKKMAGHYFEPITQLERESLIASFSLIEKVEKVLANFSHKANEYIHETPLRIVKFPEQSISYLISNTFAKDSLLAIYIWNEPSAGVGVGVRVIDKEPCWSVWVSNNISKDRKAGSKLRITIIDQAASLVDLGWHTDKYHQWFALETSTPLAQVHTHEQATKWLLEHFKQLSDAGLIPIVMQAPALGEEGEIALT